MIVRKLPLLDEQVSQRMQQTKTQLPVDEHIDLGSGRIEIRRCYVESKLDLLDDLRSWPSCQSVIMVEASREIKGVVSHQTRYYLSDLVLSAAHFNGAVRHHWSIENPLPGAWIWFFMKINCESGWVTGRRTLPPFARWPVNSCMAWMIKRVSKADASWRSGTTIIKLSYSPLFKCVQPVGG